MGNDNRVGPLLEWLKVTTPPANRSDDEIDKIQSSLSVGDVVFFDGAIKEHNPGGVAVFGWVHTRDGTVVADGGGMAEDGPEATVNVAEYAGLCAAIAHIATLPPFEVRLVGDSQLVIRQVQGTNTVRAKHLVPWVRRAKRSISELVFRGYTINLGWVIREVNVLADERANLAYDVYKSR